LYLHYTLGDIYIQLGDYTTALAVLQTTLRDGQRLGNEPVVAATLSLLGNTHKALEYWPQALAYFRRSARLYRRLGDLNSAATNEISLSELYAQQGANAQALAHG